MFEDFPPSGAADPLIGRVLSGHYRVDARIGGGAMGTVYRARHTLLEQNFAVKVLAGELAGDPDIRRRFLVEARSLASFVHRNAVQVRDCGEDGGVLYLAMDLCPGETLADLLAREGALAPDRAVAIAIQILDALAEAHRAGIVHRDLKPGNVMVEASRDRQGAAIDVVRVVDFGLARIVGAERGALPDAFASIGGNVVGTVAYMSPEQLRADDDVDGRSDLFSVGVVLYEMCAGSSPFPGTSTMSIAMRIVDASPAAWPEAVGPRVNPALNAVLSRALAKRSGDRYATAGEMASALRAAVADGPAPFAETSSVVSVVRASRGTPASDAGPVAGSTTDAPQRPRRRVGVRVAVVGGVVVLVATLAWFALRPLGPYPDDLRTRGVARLEEGRYADAVSAFSDVIDLLPRDGEAFLGRARARMELGDRNAPADLDEADRLLPDDPRVATARGRYASRVEKDGAKADQAFVRALTLDPKNVDTRFERALSELDRGLASLVEQDAAVIERDSPGDARVPWLRARLRLRAATDVQATPPAKALCEEAIVAARDAVKKDPRWADAATALATALGNLAYEQKNRGDYDGARASLAEGIEVSTLAIDRATRHADYRGQGATRARRYHDRAGLRFQQVDDPAALADLDEALKIAPKDPDLLSARAYALQQSGDHEGAIRDYERLYDVTNLLDHLFRQGFGWQRIGDGRADVGDRDGAIAAYGKAIAIYGTGMTRESGQSDFPAYSGETRTRRARWLEGAERETEWKAAEADFDEALRRKAVDSEVLLRRAELRLVQRDAKRAYDDLKAAIGGHKDRTPRFYTRFAKAAMLRAREEVAARNYGGIFAAEAVEHATRARDLLPDLAAELVPLVAEAYVCVAATALDTMSSDDALKSCESLLAKLLGSNGARESSEAARVRATVAFVRAGAALAGLDPVAALRLAREAVDLRAAESAARRWYEDAIFYERLADALDGNGDAAGAKAARERAERLPR